MCWGSTAGAAVVVADGAVLATVAEVEVARRRTIVFTQWNVCLLYTSDAADE